MTYDEMLVKADSIGLDVREKPLRESDGRIRGRRIAIRNNIGTTVEKSCMLAEEIGHYYTTSGDILEFPDAVSNRKAELAARTWGYNCKIGLIGLIGAYKAGCRNRHETAEYLDVTEEYLDAAIKKYRGMYGICTTCDNYIIYFEPALNVCEYIDGSSL